MELVKHLASKKKYSKGTDYVKMYNTEKNYFIVRYKYSSMIRCIERTHMTYEEAEYDFLKIAMFILS